MNQTIAPLVFIEQFSAFLFPITALAADVSAPNASTVQSAAWTAEDYLRAALSGAAGGLISGLVALVIGWMNNRNALKLNQQKIDADKLALKLSQEHQFEKLCHNEKKNICFKFIHMMHPEKIFKKEFSTDKINLMLFQIRVMFDDSYYSLAKKLVDYIENRSAFLYYELCPPDDFTYAEVLEKSEELFRFNYKIKYDELIILTRTSLHFSAYDKEK